MTRETESQLALIVNEYRLLFLSYIICGLIIGIALIYKNASLSAGSALSWSSVFLNTVISACWIYLDAGTKSANKFKQSPFLVCFALVGSFLFVLVYLLVTRGWRGLFYYQCSVILSLVAMSVVVIGHAFIFEQRVF